MTSDDDLELQTLFNEARSAQPRASLSERVLSDARAVQLERAREAASDLPSPSPSPSPHRFARFIELLGGWPAVSGVSVAGLAGLSLGLLAPDLLTIWLDGAAFDLPGQTATIMPDINDLIMEQGDV